MPLNWIDGQKMTVGSRCEAKTLTFEKPKQTRRKLFCYQESEFEIISAAMQNCVKQTAV